MHRADGPEPGYPTLSAKIDWQQVHPLQENVDQLLKKTVRVCGQYPHQKENVTDNAHLHDASFLIIKTPHPWKA
jgi:hypothetical protein